MAVTWGLFPWWQLKADSFDLAHGGKCGKCGLTGGEVVRCSRKLFPGVLNIRLQELFRNAAVSSGVEVGDF